MMELQTAYDELKSRSEKEISDLHLQISSISPSMYSGKCTVSIFFSGKWKAKYQGLMLVSNITQATEAQMSVWGWLTHICLYYSLFALLPLKFKGSGDFWNKLITVNYYDFAVVLFCIGHLGMFSHFANKSHM